MCKHIETPAFGLFFFSFFFGPSSNLEIWKFSVLFFNVEHDLAWSFFNKVPYLDLV